MDYQIGLTQPRHNTAERLKHIKNVRNSTNELSDKAQLFTESVSGDYLTKPVKIIPILCKAVIKRNAGSLWDLKYEKLRCFFFQTLFLFTT